MDGLETKVKDNLSGSWPNTNPNIDIGHISTLSFSITTSAYFDFLPWAVWWRLCSSVRVHIQPLSTARRHPHWCCAAEVHRGWIFSHWCCTACKEECCVLQVPQSHSQIQFRDSCSDSCQKWKKCTALWNKTHHKYIIMISKVLSFILYYYKYCSEWNALWSHVMIFQTFVCLSWELSRQCCFPVTITPSEEGYAKAVLWCIYMVSEQVVFCIITLSYCAILC